MNTSRWSTLSTTIYIFLSTKTSFPFEKLSGYCLKLSMRNMLAILTVIPILAGVTTTANAAMIVEYTFSDGNTGTASNTGTLGAAMNGSITGGSITSSPFSPDNQALLLGGNTGNGIAMPNGYDFGSAFTVESLARLDALQGSQNILFDDFGAPGVLLTIDTATQKLRLNTSTTGSGDISILSPGTFSLGQWHHVAGIYDGSFLKLYLDGILVSSQSTSGSVMNHALVTPHVGVESDGSVLPWRGAIDDFRIHDTALMVSEFNGGNSIPSVPVPAALWLFGSGLLGLVGTARRKKA